MDKLTLEHLAPYLPYGIKMIFEGKGGRSITLTGITDQGKYGITITGGEGSMWLNGGGFKPILRPLSDLTKPLKDKNGNTFILAKVLWSVSEHQEDTFDDFGIIPEYWEMSIKSLKSDYRNMDYGDIEKMIFYHFDVFGLLDSGLAININDLKEE